MKLALVINFSMLMAAPSVAFFLRKKTKKNKKNQTTTTPATIGGGGGGQGGAQDGLAGGQRATGALSDDEIEEILYMREEEKLARDVYFTLYYLWKNEPGAYVFSNIAQSEQKHMDSMLNMINLYALEDPVKSDATGVFTDSALDALYKSLVARGSASFKEALYVGALVEEVDIKDLMEAINDTDESALDKVYGSLMNASYNHLRAFVRQLDALGEKNYQSQHMTQGQVNTILGN